MNNATVLDAQAIARTCERFGVARLRVFGSVLTDRFDPTTSDVDFLVDFKVGNPDLLESYLGLKEELESVVGHSVDLVIARSVRNPYFRAAAFTSAQEVYAA
jgi:uncharacterized protein